MCQRQLGDFHTQEDGAQNLEGRTCPADGDWSGGRYGSDDQNGNGVDMVDRDGPRCNLTREEVPKHLGTVEESVVTTDDQLFLPDLRVKQVVHLSQCDRRHDG